MEKCLMKHDFQNSDRAKINAYASKMFPSILSYIHLFVSCGQEFTGKTWTVYFLKNVTTSVAKFA